MKKKKILINNNNNMIEEENIFPKEDDKNDFNQSAIINTELIISENDLNEKTISLFNNYLDLSKNNIIMIYMIMILKYHLSQNYFIIHYYHQAKTK